MMVTDIVLGSLAQVADQESLNLAESFLSVDALIIVDTSGSMADHDAPGDRTRYQAACDELAEIQGANPGKVGIVAFSDRVEFCPSGTPTFLGSGTDMVAALRFVKCADNLGIKLILLSDGEPSDRAATLREAKMFTTRIDTVYIGPERGARGRAFLAELAAITGGRTAATTQPGMLAEPIIKMLKA